MWWTTEACRNVLSSHSYNPFLSRPPPYSACLPRLAWKVTTCWQSTYFESATSQLLGTAWKTNSQKGLAEMLHLSTVSRPHLQHASNARLTSRTGYTSPPFAYTGVDYFGRLYCSDRSGNGKVWVVLVTCLALRAIHLDLVWDLTADQFFFALRHFMSRRGTPKQPLSDNRSTVLGCRRSSSQHRVFSSEWRKCEDIHLQRRNHMAFYSCLCTMDGWRLRRYGWSSETMFEEKSWLFSFNISSTPNTPHWSWTCH